VIDDPGSAAGRGVRKDGRVLDAEVMPEATGGHLEILERAVGGIVGPVIALPVTELSGFRGHPLIRWSAALSDRLADGPGPILDRPTLSLWESAACSHGAPPAPLQIVGFVSTAPWRHALPAARQLRGFGVGCVLTTTRPSPIKLLEADYAGVHVIHVDPRGAAQVLVHGDHVAWRQPRMVATRYWEERLLAHALAAGCVRLPQPTVTPEPTAPETLWEATGHRWPH